MTNRKAKIRFNGEEAEWKEVKCGIPQGSPMSSILFNLYMSSLLRKMEREVEEKWMRVYFLTFIDDVTIVLESPSWRKAEAGGKCLLGVEGSGEVPVDERMGRREGKRKNDLELPSSATTKEADTIKILGVWVDSRTK